MLTQVALAQQPIKIGAINPYSGTLALCGAEVTRSYELVVEQANAAGGVLGRKIDLVRGNAAKPQQFIASVEQLFSKDKVDLFAGNYGSAGANTASDTALSYNKLCWETASVLQSLTDRVIPKFVRVCPTSDHFAAAAVDAVRNLSHPRSKRT